MRAGNLDGAFGRLHSLPRSVMAHVPTPLEAMPNLARAAGLPRLYVKRDDCTGLAFGGNKVRQLEFYFGEAVAEGADTVLITSAVQSNYVRTAAAFASRLGMRCHGQLEERVPDTGPLYYRSGNVLLDRLMGVELHSYPVGEDETGADAAVYELAERVRADGGKPYVIPLGPTHPPLGALGYVLAAEELLTQLTSLAIAHPRIFVGSGSAATHAGLLWGLTALGSDIPVTGVCVRRPAPAQADRVANRLAGLDDLLGRRLRVPRKDIDVDDSVLAPGYGRLNDRVREAISLTARTEGLFLDPVYTGKVMAALIAAGREGRLSADETPILLHTGGTPALFAYDEALFPHR